MELYFRPEGADEVRTVRLEHDNDGNLVAVLGDERHVVRVVRREGGVLDLRIGARVVRAYTARDGKTRLVRVGAGPVATLERVDSPRQGRQRAGARAGTLTASTPAQVVSVLVAPGDRVTRGQTLVVLEAMKMEFRIKAHDDGVVEAVGCVEGEVVEAGRPLVELA
jgi:geranyl-CoA carboxylase alpha subunit